MAITVGLFLAWVLAVGALAGDVARKPAKRKADASAPKFERDLRDASTQLGAPGVERTPAPSASQTKAGYSIDWFNVTNNGGTNTAASTNYSWDATVGQSLAGSAASTNWSWDVGFWFSDGATGGCLSALAGDVNITAEVNLTDVIVLVNYVLKAGPLPQPCEANGDVNCSGGVNSTDIIFLVNYVLKAGPPPCDICNDSPLSCT